MNAPTTFLIMRHEKVDNPENIFYGVSRDLPISAQGMIDARSLGTKLKGMRLCTVVVSNLLRTRMTALKMLEGMGIPIETDFSLQISMDLRLTDVAYPLIEGKTTDQEGFIDIDGSKRVFIDDITPLADETIENAGQRFRAALMDLTKEHPNGTILVVSHGDPIAAGLAKLEEPEQEIPQVTELIAQGRYPNRGELAVVRVDTNGNLVGNIQRNPSSEILSLLKDGE